MDSIFSQLVVKTVQLTNGLLAQSKALYYHFDNIFMV